MHFTWCTKDMKKQSRTDFWLVSRELEKQVMDVYIEPSVLTDHKLIYISLSLDNTMEEKKPNKIGRANV